MTTLHKRGFTLIELLVVIAIIGILSSVVLASLNTAREKSRDARRASDLNQIKLALELYFDDNGKYPSTTDGLGVLDPDYITQVPTPPAGAGQAAYAYGADGTSLDTDYRLGATLEDDGHSLLGNDIDVDDFGVSCDAAAEYCVGP